MSRRYLAVLAGVAVLVLALGLLLRRALERDEALPAATPPSEAAALQQLSREGELRGIAEFVSERVIASAPRVEYVPETGAAGVRWYGDTVISTRPGRLLVALSRPAPDSVRRPAARLATDSAPSGWVVVIGRGPGGIVSTAMLSGGRATTRCDDQEVVELVLASPLNDHFAGAGLFSLDGRLLGVVARCAERMVAVPAPAITALLAALPPLTPDSAAADSAADSATTASPRRSRPAPRGPR